MKGQMFMRTRKIMLKAGETEVLFSIKLTNGYGEVSALVGLEFFAYHGFYDEEQKMGNKYAVDISGFDQF